MKPAKCLLLFCLFLLPAIGLSPLIQDKFFDWAYFIVMNHPRLFPLSFFVSWFCTALFMAILYFYVLNVLPPRGKAFFNTIVICNAGWATVFGAVFVLMRTPWTYDNCGREFNDRFIVSAQQKDASLCFKLDQLQLNTAGSKGGAYCVTPNKDGVYFWDPNNATTDCVSSLAKYANEVNLCSRLKELPASGVDFHKGYAKCVSEYAEAKQQPSICDLMLNSDFIYKESWLGVCRNRAARRR